MCEVSKVCTKCGVEKSLEEFHNYKASKDGFKLLCKECTRAYDRARRSDPEKKKQLEEYRLSEEFLSKQRSTRESLTVKFCTKCKNTKPVSEFYLSPITSDGYYGPCKSCQYEYARVYGQREEVRQRKRDWLKTEAGQLSLARNRELDPERGRKYRERNRTYLNSKESMRRGEKLKATPKWFKSEKHYVEFIFQVAKELSISIGIVYHVDHIVPLKSELVCGLHTLANLQILPEKINKSKSNRYWPDMP